MDKRTFLNSWQLASELLLETKARELPLTNTSQQVQSLAPAFKLAQAQYSSDESSGLIQQQCTFREKREKREK